MKNEEIKILKAKEVEKIPTEIKVWFGGMSYDLNASNSTLSLEDYQLFEKLIHEDNLRRLNN